MQSTISLLQELASKHPEYNFISGDTFKWSYDDNSIYYDKKDKDFSVYIIHELAHAILKHRDYSRDVQLIKMEADAWDKSLKLADEYKVTIDESVIQSNLDSYRDWLHKRSICTKCHATGIQDSKKTYKCLSCHQAWSVNEAKNCRLIRKSI